MNIIEAYQHEGEGYNPYIIREGWQVAQLNYVKEQDILNMHKMDKHHHTDEVFILLKGTAILIAAKEENDDFQFECVRMQPAITYNIPVNQWHNIAMSKDAQLIIVEKENTHKGDYEYKLLNNEQKDVLDAQISKYIKNHGQGK
jgi:mannose-6-phosphate isomerase-like protein (cupin superfamily)